MSIQASSSTHLVKPLRHCSLSTVIAILCIWLAAFLLISLFVLEQNVNKNHLLTAAAAGRVNHLNRKDNKEPLEEFLERSDICDSFSEQGAHLNASMFNDTVKAYCRLLLKARAAYYRLRPNPVNRFTHKLTIKGESICDNTTEMIIIVHSLHTHRDRRLAIRQTWGGATTSRNWPHIASNSLPIVRVAFIFGVHSEPNEEILLNKENKKYQDVIQGNFVESYKNMTLKSILGLHWAVEHCHTAKYLFKCDDDMFINVPLIWRTLQSMDMAWSILGPLNLGSRVYRRGIKWRLTKEEYPFAFFPPYESGSGYAISSDLLRPLATVADYVPRIFIDDVYITGILGKILGVKHVKREGFAYWTDKAPTSCAVLNGSVLTGTRVNPLKQYHIWEDITKHINCSTISSPSRLNS